MNWAYLDDIRDRFRRKPKPVIYLDCETRAQMDERMGEVLYMAYKEGDDPVKHSSLGASSAKRWTKCPGSIKNSS